MQSLATNDSMIHFNEEAYVQLNALLNTASYSAVYILVDENTKRHCLPHFLEQIAVAPKEVFMIQSGEEHKNFDSYLTLLQQLSDVHADRKALLINLGGGVITDLGGFVASTFKRGISFINVPTSLLAMVDASVGGKTGIDLGYLKNQIGTISFPEMVMIDTNYLKTLPKAHFTSGLAEMFKHGLISNKEVWKNMLRGVTHNFENIDALIYESIGIKNLIVLEDPHENGLRKTLNYGHTLGHAIESYFLKQPNLTSLLHGEAIAIGLVLESYLSYLILGFPEDVLGDIKATVHNLYGKVTLEPEAINAIIELLIYDKKNTFGNVNFVLLSDIGQHQLDCQVENDLIKEAFSYYLN